MASEKTAQQRSLEQIADALKKKAWHTPDVVELDMHQTQSGGPTVFIEDTFSQS